MDLLETIERIAPRLALYPLWARALFVTTGVAVAGSLVVYVVQYSGATGRQESARVSLAVTPSALTQADAENAEELAGLALGSSEDPFRAELTYEERGRGRIVPRQPYLDALRAGGPVDAQAALEPAKWDAARRPLVLDVKVTNDGDRTRFFNSAVLEVESSTPDTAPVPVITLLHDRPRELTVVNEGWGPADDAVVRYSLGRGGRAPRSDPPFAHAAVVGRVITTARANLDSGFAAEGADVAALRATEQAKGPVDVERLLRERRHAARPFPIASVDDVTVPVAGELSYRAPGDRALRRLRFRGQVPVTRPGGLGDFEPPSARYRAVELAVSGRAYERRVPLSQSVRPGEVDRFQIPIVVARSSRHRLRVRLVHGQGEAVTAGPFVLEMFVPRL